MILVSFDIDGTLVGGDPAGPIDFDMVREVQRRGHVIGSSSDRTLGAQRQLWEIAGIDVDFIGHKHHMVAMRERFEASRLLHIGDTQVDEYFARLAGFEFVHVDELPAPGAEDWIY